MWIFVVVAVIALIAGFGRNAFKNSYYKRNLYDTEKFRKDAQKPYMSSQQLNANIRSGKYRKPKKTRNAQKNKTVKTGQNAAADSGKSTNNRTMEYGETTSTGNKQTTESIKAGQRIAMAANKPSYSKIEQDAIEVLEHASIDIPIELETLTQEQYAETLHISDSQKRLNSGAVADARSDFAAIEKRFEDGQDVFPRTIGDYVFSSFDYKSYASDKCFSAIPGTDYSRKTNRHEASICLINKEHNVLYLETIRELGRNGGISIIPVAKDLDNKIEVTDIPSIASGLQFMPQIVFYLRCTVAQPK